MEILAKGDSMLPLLKNGNKYRVELINEDDIKEQDIIVFIIEDLVICHRIIKIISTNSGKLFYKTKGDNCKKPDPYAITFDMIIGRIVL